MAQESKGTPYMGMGSYKELHPEKQKRWILKKELDSKSYKLVLLCQRMGTFLRAQNKTLHRKTGENNHSQYSRHLEKLSCERNIA